jgi:hypothetical protein
MGFTNWQKKSDADLVKYRAASPALVAIRTHVLDMFGGANLGLYGVREVRGGTAKSSHAFGSAWDWSYRGPGREVADQVIGFLIVNHVKLGVQAIHDYQNGRIWHSDRVTDPNGGWRSQRADKFGMGQKWADWLHVEVNEDMWADGRSVAVKLGSQNPGRPVLSKGSFGDDVVFVQKVLRDKANQMVTVDGRFGTQTEMAVRNVQAFCSLRVSGVVDAATWDVLLFLAG